MNRRDFVKTVGVGFASLALPGCAATLRRVAGGASGRRPNIIFIMADDMGYGDVSCYSPDSKIHTPDIDKLASQGIRFTDAHSPSAVCTPTRYGILTGRYCWRTRLKSEVFFNYEHPLIEPERLTVASLMKQHGYSTALVGKWHLGLGWRTKPGQTVDFDKPYPWPSNNDFALEDKINLTKPVFGGPLELGFDYAFYTSGCATAQPPYGFLESDTFVTVPTERQKPEGYGRGRSGMMAPGWHQDQADVVFSRKAVEWLQKDRKKLPNKPFFLYYALSAPHDPPVVPDFMKGKTNTSPRGDMNALADWCLGQIMDTLDRLCLADNTLLIFTSDNGPLSVGKGHSSAWKWRGQKSNIWEGGHRVPFVARWPGRIRPSTVSDEPIELTDLMATCAGILGTKLPHDAGPDSYNILPALLDEKRNKLIREAIVSHSVYGVFAIRQGDWKLILETKTSGGYPGGIAPKPGAPGQLYNLADDPYEKTDLWDKHPEIVKRLTKLLEKIKRQGYSRPLSS